MEAIKDARQEAAPSIPLRCSTLSDGLNKDPQFLQTHVGSSSHPDYTDTETITVWKTQNTLLDLHPQTINSAGFFRKLIIVISNNQNL